MLDLHNTILFNVYSMINNTIYNKKKYIKSILSLVRAIYFYTFLHKNKIETRFLYCSYPVKLQIHKSNPTIDIHT